MKGKCEKTATDWKTTLTLNDVELNELLQMCLKSGTPRNRIAQSVRTMLSELFHSLPEKGKPHKCEF